MSLNIEQMYRCVRNFDFATLFVKELRWSPPVNTLPTAIDTRHTRQEIARLSGILVFEIASADGKIPVASMRAALYDELVPLFHTSLLIFLNKERTQSLWYWVKRERDFSYKREYAYMKGQPEDLFLTTLDSILADFLNTQEKSQKPSEASGLRPLSHHIVDAFDSQRLQFSAQIRGIEHDQDRDLYAMILLNRLIFLYFLERRGFLDNSHTTYLESHLKAIGDKSYYRHFLLPLFEYLSRSITARKPDVAKDFGIVPYLNGSMFLPHALERVYPAIQIPNSAFSQIFSFFAHYEWRIIDIPIIKEDEISPEILGNIFEMYLNQMSQHAAYATPPEIVEYFCKQTIHQCIVEKANQCVQMAGQQVFASLQDVFDRLDAKLCRVLLGEILPGFSILDPACGSGTFLVAALNTLVLVYSELISRAESFHDSWLEDWLSALYKHAPNRIYTLKKRIIATNLFGVDILEEATEITRLRLYLALIASLDTVKDLEPLPNLDFNLYTGNSLIGFLRMKDAESAQVNLFLPDVSSLLREHDRLVMRYREMSSYGNDLLALREDIAQRRSEAIASLNELLLEKFCQLQQRYEYRVTSRLRTRSEESASDIPTLTDIERLRPFHWCYDFDQVMNQRGGFDVIMTNPPWEILKLDSSTPSDSYQSLFYQFALQYIHQHSVARSGVQRSSLDLYKLFVEQCYNLLCDDGYCCMLVPASICTDQSATRLRQLLLEQTQITGLFCLENRYKFLSNIDSRFEFALLSFEKGKETVAFPAAFSRQEIEDVVHFPEQNAVNISTQFLRRFSPDTLATGKLKTQEDVSISEKIQHFPLLRGEVRHNGWNLKLSSGIVLGLTSRVELTQPAPGASPLYEGKTIHQFTHVFTPPRYWVRREALDQEDQQRFSRTAHMLKQWQTSSNSGYHLVFRSVASSTASRSMIATILAPEALVSNTLYFVSSLLNEDELLCLVALLNSFVVDFAMRLRLSTHLSISTVLQLPVPHLTQLDRYTSSLVQRSARLICTTEEFKNLWEVVMQSPWSPKMAATNPVERNQLQAELDGLIAHLYNVTEDEFRYILSTFPLVPAPVKIAAQNAYRDVERGLIS